uniref:Genome sequencing data, contig C319 n=1 Tax=Microcystis aeruginosa (strain PCC 7806) TaxID=267872 RepID=A8YIY8_MICA7|nr:unnamed protein product [Microcystis aeruginosa PCC 7806]
MRCNIIYTVPISTIYSAKKVNNFFENSNIVPMINIYNLQRNKPNLDYQEEALKAVAKLIEVRVNVQDVFANYDDLLSLAKASGGHVRQLMQMMRTAITSANAKGGSKIDSEDVQTAIKQVQFDFERVIPDEHYSHLVNVYLNKEINNNQIGQLMLFNTSALEYNGNDRWNYINPVVESIQAFKKVLENVRN